MVMVILLREHLVTMFLKKANIPSLMMAAIFKELSRMVSPTRVIGMIKAVRKSRQYEKDYPNYNCFVITHFGNGTRCRW